MRLLIIHNTLWAHYKSLLFRELAGRLADTDTMLVIQIALTEGHREGLGVPDPDSVGYPFLLLNPGPLEAVPLARRVSGVVQQGLAFKPDVVILTGYYDPAQLLLGILLKARGCRVVLQNESTAQDSSRGGWRETIKRMAVRLCDAYFCFGSRAAAYLVQLGADPARILVRNNAVVDATFLRSQYEKARPQRQIRQREQAMCPRNFIYVGRLTAVKNLSALVNAYALARKTVSDTINWGLVFLGEGDQKTALVQQVHTLKLTEKVQFLPGCNWQEVPLGLALADVLVLPSSSEPWGLVVNEAMVCGMPVLVSDRCGCADDLVQPGVNGFVFDPNRPDELATYLARFMTMPPTELTRMGNESERIMAAFDPTQVAGAMYQSLKSLTTPAS